MLLALLLSSVLVVITPRPAYALSSVAAAPPGLLVELGLMSSTATAATASATGTATFAAGTTTAVTAGATSVWGTALSAALGWAGAEAIEGWFWSDGDPAVQPATAHNYVTVGNCRTASSGYELPCTGSSYSQFYVEVQALDSDVRLIPLSTRGNECNHRNNMSLTVFANEAKEVTWNETYAGTTHECTNHGFAGFDVYEVDPNNVFNGRGAKLASGLPVTGEGAYLETTGHCIDQTGNLTTVTRQSESYTAADSTPHIPAVNCPAGSVLVRYKVDRVLPEDSMTLVDWTHPDEAGLAAHEYADCIFGGCATELQHDEDGDGLYDPCGAGECVDWINHPDTQTQTQTQTSTGTETYVCKYGTHVLPIDQCEMFHDPAGVDPGVDTDLETQMDHDPAPDPNPVPIPPGTPVPAETPEPTPVESGCGPFSFLNPLAGLAQGVACALEWAFIPSQASVQTSMDTAMAELETTPPFHIMTAIGGAIDNFLVVPTVNNCSGYIWSFQPPAMYDPAYVGSGDGVSVDMPTFDAAKPVLGIPCEPPFDWSLPYGFMVAVVWIGTLFGLYNLFGVAVQGPRFVHNVDSADLASIG